jgi:hypothetical protein
MLRGGNTHPDRFRAGVGPNFRLCVKSIQILSATNHVFVIDIGSMTEQFGTYGGVAFFGSAQQRRPIILHD